MAENKFLDLERLTQFKEIIMSYINGKVNIDQGSENANKILSTDSNGNVVVSESPIPPIESTDDGKMLQVVNGELQLVSVNIKTIYTGTTEPTSDIGDDGDVYLLL